MFGGISLGLNIFQWGDNFFDKSASSSFENPELTRLIAEYLNDSPSIKSVYYIKYYNTIVKWWGLENQTSYRN